MSDIGRMLKPSASNVKWFAIQLDKHTVFRWLTDDRWSIYDTSYGDIDLLSAWNLMGYEDVN